PVWTDWSTEHSDYNLMARICGTRLFNWRSAKAERRTDEAEQPVRFSGLCIPIPHRCEIHV
ncbi:hypothetical protein MOZ60_05660, partial [Stecheria sp. CLA-KB-P133]|nr:hypothetical protein [Stecheria sp. CLA-KB-P133]